MINNIEAASRENERPSSEFKKQIRSKLENEIRALALKEIESLWQEKISRADLTVAAQAITRLIYRGADDQAIDAEIRKLAIELVEKVF